MLISILLRNKFSAIRVLFLFLWLLFSDMTNQSGKHLLTNQAVSANEQRFRALVIATSDIIYSMSADWRVMRQLDGRGFLSDTSTPITDWMPRYVYAADLEKVQTAIDQAIATKNIFQLEHRVLRADGTMGWTFSRAVPILDDQGEIIEWFGTAADITERKRAEDALRESQERSEQQKRLYETITASTPDLIYVFDLEYRFTYANSALLTMWGKTWDTAIGKGLLENGYEPWHAEMHEREIDQIIATKKPIRGEVSFPHAVLGKRVYDYILTPVLNDQGQVEAVAGTTRDVTERKQWEETLAQSSEELQAINEEMVAINEEQAASNEELSATNEELALVNQQLTDAQKKVEEAQVALRLAINAANFGTWYIHSVTRKFITDTRLKELFGYYPDEELSIEQALAQVTEEYRGFVADKLENAIYNNGDYDLTYPVIGLHDEKLRWLRAIGNLKADPSGDFSAFTGVVMDITETYLASKQVERAEERLRLAIDAAELGSFSINAVDRIFISSPRLKEFFGFAPEDEVPYEAAINQIHPDYRQAAANLVEESFTSGKRFDMEYPVVGHHDGKIRWVRGVGTMQYDSDGKSYFTGVLNEITERKQDEQRKNDFIAMVSHELKTPLTSLNGILQLLTRKIGEVANAAFPGGIDRAQVQVKKMTAMINGFLNVSRLEAGKIQLDKQSFDLGALVSELIEEAVILGSDHHIHIDHCPSVSVLGDRDKIGSVISNLLSNAIKYSPKGKNILISSNIDAEQVIISVKDEGMGIKPQSINYIFDRYYRVETNHTQNISGFGIGLYISAEIVKHHGGEIGVESESGVGSTFWFRLPLERKI